MAITFTTGNTFASGDTVTATKFNNVVNAMTLTLATAKVLGRSTAGTGNMEEIDCTAAGRALLDDAAASDQRTTLGLGTMATQAASAVAITGGTVTGITDLAVADGGTAASTASGARTNLGLGSISTAASTISTSGPSGGADGDLWFQY